VEGGKDLKTVSPLSKRYHHYQALSLSISSDLIHPEIVIRDINSLNDYLYDPSSMFNNVEAKKVIALSAIRTD
jgi:hypothetical protein